MEHKPDMTTREHTLLLARDLTCGARSATYGDPKVNLSCAGALWAIYKSHAGTRYSAAHDEAIHQVLAKIARIACGVLHADNYIDIAAYAAIALECETHQAGAAAGLGADAGGGGSGGAGGADGDALHGDERPGADPTPPLGWSRTL